MARYCYLCETQLSGCFGSSVPLFKPTKNKEFTVKSFCTADSIVLSELVKSVGIKINVAAASLPSVCKKCARKIVSYITLFHELEAGFRKSSSHEETDGGNKRLHSI